MGRLVLVYKKDGDFSLAQALTSHSLSSIHDIDEQCAQVDGLVFFETRDASTFVQVCLLKQPFAVFVDENIADIPALTVPGARVFHSPWPDVRYLKKFLDPERARDGHFHRCDHLDCVCMLDFV